MNIHAHPAHAKLVHAHHAGPTTATATSNKDAAANLAGSAATKNDRVSLSQAAIQASAAHEENEIAKK